MPFQEEYLDKLLNDMTGDLERQARDPGEPVGDPDLASLLADSQDDDLKEIQDLLEKSDNNEWIADASEAEDREEAPQDAVEAAAEEVPEAESEEVFEDAAWDVPEDVFEEVFEAAPEDGVEAAAWDVPEGTFEEVFEDTSEDGVEDAPEDVTGDSGAGEESALSGVSEKEQRRLQKEAKKEERKLRREAKKKAAQEAKEQKKAEKAAKKAAPQDSDVQGGAPVGLLAKLKDMLLEEVEEPENEVLSLSHENEGILKEMDQEDKKGKKAKKAKKPKKKPKKEKKAKKEKKPKKEKKVKKAKSGQRNAVEDIGKTIPAKGLLAECAVFLSLGVLLVSGYIFLSEYSVKKVGREAFYEGDYQTCYQNLYGKNLNESEQAMLSKCESILRLRLWIGEYELLVQEGEEAKALDSLLQAVYTYPDYQALAAQQGAAEEVAEIYQELLQILADKYQLTEAEAYEIIEQPDDIQYSRMVWAIVQGEGFDSWNQQKEPEETEAVQAPLVDELPEETGLDGTEFIDNNTAR